MKILIECCDPELKKLYNVKKNFNSDLGIDLYCPSDVIFFYGESNKINFKIKCEPCDKDQGYMLVPRSSISKTPLRMSNSVGIIDPTYRGEIMACCDCLIKNNLIDMFKTLILGKKSIYEVKKGTRLFQLVSFDGKPLEYELVDKINETERNEGGFGSTGK